MIKLEFPTHTITVQKLPFDDNLGIEIEAKGGADLRDVGPVYVNHALVDRIAELEAQLAAVGAGGITAGRPLMGEPVADLAADGDLFRRMIEAMQTDGEAFAERMGALATDEPPTLAEFRQMLREALGDPVEPFDPDLMFAEFSVPAAARSDKLARYLWGLLELSGRYGFDIAPGASDWAEIYPNEKRGKHSEAYNDIVIRDWWCK